MPVKQKRLAHSPCQSYNTPNPESRKTLPGRDWQTPAAPGQEAFLTPYLTTVGAGTRGNSGFKGAKKYLIPSEKHRKALQITTKNLVQAFGSKMPGVRVSPLGPSEYPSWYSDFLFFKLCRDSCMETCNFLLIPLYLQRMIFVLSKGGITVVL